MAVELMPNGLSVKRTRRFLASILSGEPVPQMELVDAVRSGLSSVALECVLESGLTPAELIETIGMSERTLRRRLKGRSTLDAAESDRLLRIAQLLGEGTKYIGDADRALGWFREPNWALGGRRPLEMLAAEAGAALVRQSLLAIAYGGVA